MKTFFESEIMAIKPKPFTHSKGNGYNFSFAMKGDLDATGKESIVWISAVSFHQEIVDRGKYLVRGRLAVRPPWNDRPASLQLIVEEAIHLEQGQYVVRTKRDTPTVETPKPTEQERPQGYSTSNGLNNPPRTQVDVMKRGGQTEFPDMGQSDEIPF